MYNKKVIMKRAWQIKKVIDVDFSEALKMSWKIAKEEAALKEEAYVQESGKVTWNLWSNFGMVRAYYKRDWVSKYQNGKKYNYVKLV